MHLKWSSFHLLVLVRYSSLSAFSSRPRRSCGRRPAARRTASAETLEFQLLAHVATDSRRRGAVAGVVHFGGGGGKNSNLFNARSERHVFPAARNVRCSREVSESGGRSFGPPYFRIVSTRTSGEFEQQQVTNSPSLRARSFKPLAGRKGSPFVEQSTSN